MVSLCSRDLEGGTASELGSRVTDERTVTRKGIGGERAREERQELQQGGAGCVGDWEGARSHSVCIKNLHKSAKCEKLTTRVASAIGRKGECDKGSGSLFILIKKDSADITQEVFSPRRGMVMMSPAL